MFVNEDNVKRVLKVFFKVNIILELMFLVSDSWGVKIYLVKG